MTKMRVLRVVAIFVVLHGATPLLVSAQQLRPSPRPVFSLPSWQLGVSSTIIYQPPRIHSAQLFGLSTSTGVVGGIVGTATGAMIGRSIAKGACEGKCNGSSVGPALVGAVTGAILGFAVERMFRR